MGINQKTRLSRHPLLVFFYSLSLFLLNAASISGDETKYPQGFKTYKREGYTVCYNGRDKIPLWVFERLTNNTLNKKESRDSYIFYPDMEIPAIHRVTDSEYNTAAKKYFYDKGHMAAATNHQDSSQAMAQTFLYSNVCPQHKSCNRGVWKKLEQAIKKDLRLYPVIDVISGPLFLPREEEEGEKFVIYHVIGPNDVAVPTHFFKIIYYRSTNEELLETAAYIIPNNVTVLKRIPEDYLCTIEKVEKVSGLIFARD